MLIYKRLRFAILSAALLSTAQTHAAETVYTARIQPLFDAYCIRCHGEEKQKGGRRLDSYEQLGAESDSGTVLQSGNSAESLLVQRTSLPLDDDDHMPPESKRQPTPEELVLLRQWIDAGADPDAPSGEPEAPAEKAETESTTTPLRPWSEIEAAAARIAAAGVFEVLPLSQNNPGLRVRIGAGAEAVHDADLAALAPIAAQILWLDLSRSAIGDDALAHLAGMARLERLHLEGTAVTSAALKHLASLAQLTYLNLHGCHIDDTGIGALAALPALRQVFLWGTDVTPEGAERLRTLSSNAAAVREIDARIDALRAERAALAVKVELGVGGDGATP